jgi:hypothetical protein
MVKEDKMGWLGKMAGKVLTSPKFLEYISGVELFDLVAEALQIPGMRDKIVNTLSDMSSDIRDRYEVRKWNWHADTQENALIVELFIDRVDMRKDFNTRFMELLRSTREKFGGGWDWFVKLYKISKISCHDVDDCVRITIVTPRVRDLEKVILEILTADVKYEGGEGE